MKSKANKNWNASVAQKVRALAPVKNWLAGQINDKTTDWGSQKSAHQALKLLEMAEYEMWNMQWWANKQQVQLDQDARDTIA